MSHSTSLHRLSEVVRALRFPLILLVVFAHIPLASDYALDLPWELPASGLAWYHYVSRIGSYVFGYVTVPMFFLFSGYYMFSKPRAWWTRAVYGSELKKRLTTLLIPYLIWCTLSFVTELGLSYWRGEGLGMDTGSAVLDRLLHAYLFGPANLPLWYVRDLLLMTLLAPLVDWVGRRAPWLILLFFGVHVAGWWVLPVLSSKAIIYVSLGAFLGQRQLDMVALAERGRYAILPLFLVSTLLLPFLPQGAWHAPLMALYVPLAMAAFLIFGGWIYDRRPRLQAFFLRMEAYVFFIYVVHEVLILSAVRGFFYKQGWLETVWGYFVCGGLVVAICLVAYAVLARVARRPLAISLGGRL